MKNKVIFYHSCLYARRLRGAAILRVKEPALSCLGTAHLHASVSQHRLARARNHTPLRRRIERFKLHPKGGVCLSKPIAASIFCPSQDSVWKYVHLLAYLSPLPPNHAHSNDAAFPRVGESGSRPDLFMFMGFRRDSREVQTNFYRQKMVWLGTRCFTLSDFRSAETKIIIFLFPSNCISIEIFFLFLYGTRCLKYVVNGLEVGIYTNIMIFFYILCNIYSFGIPTIYRFYTTFYLTPFFMKDKDGRSPHIPHIDFTG